MCISCERYDRFLIIWKTFFVQCSYAYAALLVRSRTGKRLVRSDPLADRHLKAPSVQQRIERAEPVQRELKEDCQFGNFASLDGAGHWPRRRDCDVKHAGRNVGYSFSPRE